MTKIPYDVTHLDKSPRLRGLPVADASPTKRKRRPPKPGSFEDRVSERSVDLLKLIEDGVPPVEFLPASEGMLVRGKRHLIAAPAKTGKSIGMLVHWVDMALAGARVVIFDRENGSAIYALRLADICEARGFTKRQRAGIRKRLRYYEFPRLQRADGDALAATFGTADVVVLDSQRMFLADLGFKENEADDYAEFMAKIIDPLFRAGVATVILDNTGHKEGSRARGTVTKADLNEVMFSMASTDFDLHKTGTLTLKVEASRFGNRGEWTMPIGGGAYGSWSTDQRRERPDFLAAVLAKLGEASPLGQDKLVDAAREGGVKIGNPEARRLFSEYVERGDLKVVPGRGYEKGGDSAS